MEHGIELEALLRDAGWLRRLAARLVGDGAADDLAQETWLSALQHPPRSLEEPRPWLARVARNLAANARRGGARREAREERAHVERSEPSPDELAQAAEAQRLVAEAVTRLEPPLRAAIVLCYYQGLDSRAAAAQLGVPASTLRTRLQRALEELRAELDRERGRESWMMLLVPLARGARPTVAAAAAGGTLALVGTGAVVLLGALGYSAWRAGTQDEPGPEPVRVAELVNPEVRSDDVEGTRAESTREVVTDETLGPASRATPPTTARVAGTLLVDGLPPEWPIQLTLVPKLPRSSAGPVAPRKHPSHPSLVLAPEQRGAFAFEGLPLDWQGQLQVEWFSFLAGGFTQDLDAPAEGLVLQLTAKPEILGRLVEADGRPAGDVEIAYERALAGFGTLSSRVRTLADGRFRIWLPPQSGPYRTSDVNVRIGSGAEGPRTVGGDNGRLALVADAGPRGWLELADTPFDPVAGLDLGELVLEPARERALLVRGKDGAPLAGACARLEVERPRIECASTTDAHGEGRLFLPERPCTVRVGAFGFADQLVTVGPTDALEFTLEPLTVLSVSLRGTNLDSLALRSAQAAFVWDPTDGPDWEYQEDAGATQWNERTPARDDQPWRYGYDLFESTTLTLVGLVPEQEFELELFDSDGRSLAVHTARLAAGERATLSLGEGGEIAPEPGTWKRRSPAEEPR